MTELKSLGNVFYPPVGIVHNISDIRDLIEPHLTGMSSIVVNTSAQPNSHPHLGTITTMMTAFAVAKHLSQIGLPVTLEFDALENAPAEKVTIDGVEYQRSLDRVPSKIGKGTLADDHLASFRHIFGYIGDIAGVSHRIQLYREFQAGIHFRTNLLRILNRLQEFEPVLSPAEKRVRVRFPCPTCGFSDKPSMTVQTVELTQSHAVIESMCHEHGRHAIMITADSGDYVDTNTPLRSVLKQAIFAENKRNGVFTVMVDGGDWAGTWASAIEILGATMLGYQGSELPVRLYAPVILDWSGAKFSKSMYLHSGAYAHIPEELINYEAFRRTYGERGLDILWEEVSDWVQDPRKLFRNYTLDYMDLVLKSERG